MCCYCMKYETKILVTCWPLNNWWQLSSKTHNSFAPLTVPGNYILSSKMNFQLHRVSFSSKLFRNNVTHHLMISPVPPQRWLNFSTRQGDPGPHEDAPLKLWPALNSAAAVQAQLLPHWNVLITVPCECLQRSAASLHWQAELQAGGGQCGTVASAQLNWRVWNNGALCSLSFGLNYSATQFRHKSVHLHCSRGKVMLQEQRYIWIYNYAPPQPAL